MSTNPIATEPQTEAEQDAQFYRGILHGLITMGNAIAETLHQELTAPLDAARPDAAPSKAERASLAVAFDKVARATRRCIVLARAVREPVERARDVSPAQRRVQMRAQVIRQVEDAIHREAGAYEAETLRAEMMERVDSPEFEADRDRPIELIIREILADMGLRGAEGAAIWKRRTPRDVARLHARAAAPAQTALGPFNLPMPPPDWIDPGDDAPPPPPEMPPKMPPEIPKCRGGP